MLTGEHNLCEAKSKDVGKLKGLPWQFTMYYAKLNEKLIFIVLMYAAVLYVHI